MVAGLVALAVFLGLGLLRTAVRVEPGAASLPGFESLPPDTEVREEAASGALAGQAIFPSLDHPLRFVARHEHLIGYCTGDLVLGESEIVFETSRHGTWRWPVSAVEELVRASDTELEIRGRSPERNGEADTSVSTFRFTFLRPGLSEADFLRYQEVMKARRGASE